MKPAKEEIFKDDLKRGRPQKPNSAGIAINHSMPDPTDAPFVARSSDVNCRYELWFRQNLDERYVR